MATRSQAVSAAGTARPLIRFEGQVPLGYGGYDLRVFVAEGENIHESNINLYHEPLIYIQADDQGGIVHKIDDDVDDTALLILRVRWDLHSQLIQERIQRFFAEKRNAPSESWIIGPLVVANAWFESRRNPNIKSNALPQNTSFASKGEYLAYFPFENRQAAAEFIARLQHQADQLKFTYSFEGVSDERCTAKASYEDIQRIDRFRDLFGEGRVGYVQRHQLAGIYQEIGKMTSTRSRCSDAELLVQMVNQAMDQLGSPESVPLEQLKEYAVLDNDLRSDLETSLNEMIRSVSRTQDQEAFRQAISQARGSSSSVGGTVDFLETFSAKLSDRSADASEEARQSFRDVLRKHGISGEWEGERYIPKTLDVYSKERMASHWTQGVEIEYGLTKGATDEF